MIGASRLQTELLTGDEIEDIPDPDPLIDGVLDFNSTAMIYGPSGAGKSFVVLDWGLCVATGTLWHGHKVFPGPVLYIMGEGLHGTRSRYQAWKEYHEISSIDAIMWGPRAVNIQEAAGKNELLEAVTSVNPAPVLTILDTVARHIPGGDENSFETMSHVVEMLDRIKQLTGGCALAVHHTGKNEEAGSRGHSSLKGALDTEIMCTKPIKSPIVTLTVTKQKNHPDGHILGKYELVDVGTSMVLGESVASNRNDDLAYEALQAAEEPLSFSDWKAAAATLGVPRGSFAKARQRLVNDDRVILGIDTKYQISPN